ncbi:alpha/beta hydrolase [Sphingobacterium bambusae]|uniref:Alpha/beta hydrolase n=1 Tax=Sphingobacterium bambusae TaxID=662858 RepID=A0ABW6BAL3_9SPHI|nr:alpha/beta hydrolase [Sphingobacterium bambusae]WPL48845.1 alpha/beta hydrolase [Sphingobacterium bambusae]
MVPLDTTDHYTFQLSDKVTRQKVTFKNRFGIKLSGDLYVPKNIGATALPAIAISGPYGAVKEQSSGLYANQLALRGFITLAFDPSYTGESSGEPRHISSPDINTEDFSAAVDYLGIQKNIDRNKIGVIGICGFGGYALNAAAPDKRIKAVATSTMYDISRGAAKGYYDKKTSEERTKEFVQINEQRWKDAENGTPAYGATGLANVPENAPQFVTEYAAYYRTNRGFHPRSLNSNGSWSLTNSVTNMNAPILAYIEEISPRPILIIAGEKAHSRYFSETAYESAAGLKELLIVPNAVHTDLYDKIDVIPFDKLAKFFKQNLK